MLAICKFFVLNKGLTWPAGFEEDPAAHAAFLQECFAKHNIEKVYEHWRHWVATNTQATKFRVTGKKEGHRITRCGGGSLDTRFDPPGLRKAPHETSQKGDR